MHPGSAARSRTCCWCRTWAAATTETRTAMADLAARNVVGGPDRPAAADAGDRVKKASRASKVAASPSAGHPARRGGAHRRPRRRERARGHGALARAITGLGAAGRREDLREPGGRPVPGADRHRAVGADAGRDDARGLDTALQAGADAADDGDAVGQRDRDAHLSGELLSPQGAPRESRVPEAGPRLRRPGARHDGGAADAAGRRPQDRQPGADPGVQEPAQHLRRHARAPHLEPARLGADAHARGDRAGAVRGDGRALVALHQPVSRDVGTERVPSRLSEMRRLCPASRCARKTASRACRRRPAPKATRAHDPAPLADRRKPGGALLRGPGPYRPLRSERSHRGSHSRPRLADSPSRPIRTRPR